MLTQKKLEDCSGKTLIETYVSNYDGTMMLVFGDFFGGPSMFACLTARNGYEGCDAEIEDGDFNPGDWKRETLINAGVMSEGEIVDWYAARDAKRREDTERAEKQQLERLRKKYES